MRLLTAAAVTLMLSACGLAPQVAEPAAQAPPPLEHHPHEPEPSPRGVEPMDQDPAPQERPDVDYSVQEPICTPGRALAVAFVGFDAALGTRFHWARVRNCTDEALTVPEPVFRGRDLGNIWGDMIAEPAHGPEPGPLLEPDGMAQLTMSWASNGRCERGIQDLRLQLGEESFDSPENCLQLGGSFAPERDADLRWTWEEGR